MSPNVAELYVHSYSYRHRLAHDPDFTVFSMIDDAARRGLSGLNVSVYPPAYTHLSGGDPGHLDRVAAALRDAGLGVDVETATTSWDGLGHVIDVGRRLGAQIVRTCTNLDPAGPAAATMRRMVADLTAIAPRAADAGLTIVIEKHEDLVSSEVAEVLGEVDSPAVRAVFDYGNDMAVAEVPHDTVEVLLPWVITAHLKDQVVVRPDPAGPLLTVGVPFGEGIIPIRSLTERLLGAGVRRLCLQPTWSYVAPVQPARTKAAQPDHPIFTPVELTQPGICLDADDRLIADPRSVFRDEADALDRTCAWTAAQLADLPMVLPQV